MDFSQHLFHNLGLEKFIPYSKAIPYANDIGTCNELITLSFICLDNNCQKCRVGDSIDGFESPSESINYFV